MAARKKLPAITGLASHKVAPPIGNVKLPSIGSVNRSVAKERNAVIAKRLSKLKNQGRPSLGEVNRTAAKTERAAMNKRIAKVPNQGRPSLGEVTRMAAKETAAIKKGIKAGAKSAGNIKLPSLASVNAKPAKKAPVRKPTPKKRKVAKRSGSTGYVMSAPSDIGFDPYNFKY